MRTTSRSAKSAAAVLLAAATILIAGCPHNNPKGGGEHGLTRYPHNLTHLRCGGHHTPENYPIAVAVNQQVLVNPDDTIIFACEGDSISWFSQDSNTLIKINFTDSFADDLLGEGRSKFEKKHETDKQTVREQTGHTGRVYKYSITVDDGTHTFTLDPHVIPMGK
jgi:hypothetical protein